MNTAPFYELHDRLYDCASAGALPYRRTSG